MKIVVDTNIFIDWCRQRKPLLKDLILFKKKDKLDLFVPTVVIMEFWVGQEMKKTSIRQQAKKMFVPFEKVVLTEEIAQLAGDLLRKKEVVQPMDAIVAATTLSINAKLATRNKKHFSKIKGLKLY